MHGWLDEWMEGWDGDASLRWQYGWHKGLVTIEEMGVWGTDGSKLE